MMNRLYIFVLVAVLVAVVTGCGGAHHYDGRLTAADSLMQPDPDSALTLVEAVNADSLATEGDRAYHDLLLTQARYKAYQEITASDDSAITCAMGYYRSHSGEREKLTRAYLYKGAVMEELGHVDSAMFYYKTAEAAADEKDYINLGQINTRIAELFRIYYGNAQICYDKYKKALWYYKKTNNKPFQVDCLFYMGGCSGITTTDDPKRLLAQASQLAQEINDSAYYFKCQEILCRQYAQKDSSLLRAKQIATHCLKHYRKYVNNDLLLDLAQIYTSLSIVDSAKYYLELVNEKVSDHAGQVCIRKYLTLSKIAILEGDIAKSNYYDKIAHQVSDSINNNKYKYQIQKIENTNNSISVEKRNHTIGRLRLLLLSLIIASITVLAAFAFYHHCRIRNTKAIIRALKKESDTQLATLSSVQQKIDAYRIDNQKIKDFVNKQLEMLREITAACYHDPQNKLGRQVREILQFNDNNQRNWEGLYDYIDVEYNNIMSTTRKNYPQLDDKDMLLLALSCLGFTYVQIAMIMGYTNATSIGTLKSRLAAKMELDGSLNDYISSFANR